METMFSQIFSDEYLYYCIWWSLFILLIISVASLITFCVLFIITLSFLAEYYLKKKYKEYEYSEVLRKEIILKDKFNFIKFVFYFIFFLLIFLVLIIAMSKHLISEDIFVKLLKKLNLYYYYFYEIKTFAKNYVLYYGKTEIFPDLGRTRFFGSTFVYSKMRERILPLKYQFAKSNYITSVLYKKKELYIFRNFKYGISPRWFENYRAIHKSFLNVEKLSKTEAFLKTNDSYINSISYSIKNFSNMFLEKFLRYKNNVIVPIYNGIEYYITLTNTHKMNLIQFSNIKQLNNANNFFMQCALRFLDDEALYNPTNIQNVQPTRYYLVSYLYGNITGRDFQRMDHPQIYRPWIPGYISFLE